MTQKLKEELASACLSSDRCEVPAVAQVENLPYLGAIIQETVRLHPGVMARQVRISPEDPILYTNKTTGVTYRVPPGTVTSMSPLVTHMQSNYFEEPYEFRPERWIDNPKLGRWFMGFARGSRNCLGLVVISF